MKHTQPFWAKLGRWWRNRAAATKIIDFLVACKQCTVSGFSPIYARRFVDKVRLVQKHIRAYLACKHARVEALLIQWDKTELKFIKGMFQEAVDRRRRGFVAESSVAGSFLKWQAKRPSALAKAVAAAAEADLKARRCAVPCHAPRPMYLLTSRHTNPLLRYAVGPPGNALDTPASAHFQACQPSPGFPQVRRWPAWKCSSSPVSAHIHAHQPNPSRDAVRMSKWSSLESKIESFVDRADGKLGDDEVGPIYVLI